MLSGSMMAFGLAILAVLSLGVIFAPSIAEWRRKPVTDRNGGSGARVALSQGATHIQTHGPDDAPTVVLIHGLTTPQYVWDQMIEPLTDLGFRVIRYDLYGRGYSDRPGGAQDRSFFLRQLSDVLAETGAPERVSLVGFSMGGAIATAFASEHPHRVERLVLIAPAGLIHQQSRFALTVRDTPVLGSWLMCVIGGSVCRSGVIGPADHTEVSRKQRQEVDYRGFLPAVLSSQRHLLREDQSSDHATLGKERIPVLAIWGRDDTVIPLAAREKLKRSNSEAMHVAIEGADHRLPYTHASDVFDALGPFLRGA